MKYLLIFLSLFFVSCDGPQGPAPKAATQANFSIPQYVATLPDGRVVNCAKVDRGAMTPHYVYFVDNGDGRVITSTNYQDDKAPQVTVEIDGRKYKVESLKNEN